MTQMTPFLERGKFIFLTIFFISIFYLILTDGLFITLFYLDLSIYFYGQLSSTTLNPQEPLIIEMNG